MTPMDYTVTMRRLVIRQTNPAILSAEQAERVVRGCADAKILDSNGRTMLVDVDPCAIDALRENLPGWLVTEEGPPVPLPDHCIHVKERR